MESAMPPAIPLSVVESGGRSPDLETQGNSSEHPRYLNPEDRRGLEALTAIKIGDPRCAIYNSFEWESSTALDYRANLVRETSSRLQQALAREVRDSLPGKPKYQYGDEVSELAERLGSEVESFYDLLTKTQTVLSYDLPQESMVRQVECWMQDRIDGFPESPHPIDLDKYRRLGSVGSSLLDRLLAQWFLPRFEFLLGWLRIRSSRTETATARYYPVQHLHMVSKVFVIIILSIFLLLPLALISYHAVDRVMSTSIVLVFYVASCILVQSLHKDVEVQLILVFAYGAILSTMLQGLP